MFNLFKRNKVDEVEKDFLPLLMGLPTTEIESFLEWWNTMGGVDLYVRWFETRVPTVEYTTFEMPKAEDIILTEEDYQRLVSVGAPDWMLDQYKKLMLGSSKNATIPYEHPTDPTQDGWR